MSNVEIVKGYIPGSIGRVAELHGTYYHEHWDFSLFFEAKVATELSEFLGRYDEKRDAFWTRVVLKAPLPLTGFTQRKKERIFGGSLYPISCVEEVLAISLLKKLLTFVEAKDINECISGLLRALKLRDTSTRRVVLNSLNNTKEYSGAQRLTNSDSKCHSSSLTLAKSFFIEKEEFLEDLSYN